MRHEARTPLTREGEPLLAQALSPGEGGTVLLAPGRLAQVSGQMDREGALAALAPLPGHSRLGGMSQDAVDDLGVFCPE